MLRAGGNSGIETAVCEASSRRISKMTSAAQNRCSASRVGPCRLATAGVPDALVAVSPAARVAAAVTADEYQAVDFSAALTAQAGGDAAAAPVAVVA